MQGTDGFEKQMERLMELTAYQVKQMKEQKEKFYLLNDEPECTNVIFWYVPERLRPRQCPQYGTRDWQLELGNVSLFLTIYAGDWLETIYHPFQVTAKLKGRMMNSGSIMISCQPLGMYPNFFRSIISNQAIQESDIDYMLSEMERLGHDL